MLEQVEWNPLDAMPDSRNRTPYSSILRDGNNNFDND